VRRTKGDAENRAMVRDKSGREGGEAANVDRVVAGPIRRGGCWRRPRQARVTRVGHHRREHSKGRLHVERDNLVVRRPRLNRRLIYAARARALLDSTTRLTLTESPILTGRAIVFLGVLCVFPNDVSLWSDYSEGKGQVIYERVRRQQREPLVNQANHSSRYSRRARWKGIPCLRSCSRPSSHS